jgi:hypothetical protein
LTPAVHWKSHAALAAPTNIDISGNILSWTYAIPTVRFSVYAVPTDQVGTSVAFTNVLNLLGVSYSNQYDLSAYSDLFATHVFAVAALDRYGNEFTPTYVGTSVESPAFKPVIRTSSTGVQVELDSYSTVELFSVNGVLLDKTSMMGTYEKALHHGVYILLINGKVFKIVL